MAASTKRTAKGRKAKRRGAQGRVIPQVEIFTLPGCLFCQKTKELLEDHKIAYLEHDVSDDLDSLERMIELSEQGATPVILVGKKVIVGFDPEKILAALGLDH